jgi:predicted carbohydrate-binding protein with CBM5 and CBM33 domain
MILATRLSSKAITIFQSNVDSNPNSANAYDSLVDGYLKDGQLAAAKRASDRSVQLARQWENPDLATFERKAKKIDQRLQEQEMEKKSPGKKP